MIFAGAGLNDARMLSRRIDRTLRHNLYWSAAYNVAGIGPTESDRQTPVRAAGIMVLSAYSSAGAPRMAPE